MKTFQAKLTEEEIKAAYTSLAIKTAGVGLTEESFERLKYLGSRLLKIQKGEPEIETETTQAEPEKGWG